jgi:hypothetical protein
MFVTGDNERFETLAEAKHHAEDVFRTSGVVVAIVDSNQPITVTVTAEDIRNGKPKRIHACPIALALKRATGCKDAWAGPFSIAVEGGSKGTHNTPP